MSTEQKSPKFELVHCIVDELNKENIPQKILRPGLHYVKSILAPYYTLHIVLQLLIVCLLFYIIFKIRKNHS